MKPKMLLSWLGLVLGKLFHLLYHQKAKQNQNNTSHSPLQPSLQDTPSLREWQLLPQSVGWECSSQVQVGSRFYPPTLWGEGWPVRPCSQWGLTGASWVSQGAQRRLGGVKMMHILIQCKQSIHKWFKKKAKEWLYLKFFKCPWESPFLHNAFLGGGKRNNPQKTSLPSMLRSL